ncbi:hypothetical protein ncot_01740 [Nocardioides sp. JQ2195]|uniref:fluoride efflux transporter FluC n=1 Tax=Nocardioides sp. JQ2195 TaxID=2592334 RepID=UPI00143E16F9|nr:CrcB family protein [Nocardioides sp. JQ2195]QIX25449.1 hypothetical protein ncot_01740 [Nocardioides sp. JQ2195]
MTPLLVALGAAVGAPLRFVAGHFLDRDHPNGTLVVNVVGSFLLGLLSSLALSGHEMALLGVGFCGGLTTYSSFAVQADRLGARRGTTYVVVTITLSLTACALGWLLA